MTREEEIIQAAQLCAQEYGGENLVTLAFKKGAEWADEHLKSPWKSVEEDPKKSGTYFVLKDAYYVDAAQFDINSKEWFNCADGSSITHWMQIPPLTD